MGTSRAASQLVLMKVIFLEQNVTLCLQAGEEEEEEEEEEKEEEEEEEEECVFM